MSALAQARARQALSDAGLDADVDLQPLRSVTNEVWLAGEFLIRLNRRQDLRLQKEMALGRILPPEVGYPEIVTYGGEPGGDFLVSRRPEGRILAHMWPRLTAQQRAQAVSDVAALARAVHLTPAVDLPAIDDPPLLESVTDTSPTERVVAAIDLVAHHPHLESEVVEGARAMVRDLTLSLEPFHSTTLVHGDIHFENVLWDGQRASGLLDYKWARPAPADLDLDVLLRYFSLPSLFVSESHREHALAEDYLDAPWQLAEAYPELFATPRQFDRMRLYSLAYDIRELLLYPPPLPPDRLPEQHAYHRLARTVAGTSHLDLLAHAPAA